MPVPLPDHAITLATAGQRALATNSEVIEAEQAVVKAQAAVSLSKLEYVPDVAVMGGYSYQTAVGLLPTDFSFLGVVATFNVFDFGKREKTLKERKSYLELAQMNLQAVKSRVTASVQSAYIEVEEAARSRDVRRAQLSDSVDEARHFEAEADLAQAEWKYRVARQQLHKLVGMH
jgi:outer membrane protein TolC